MSGIRLTLYSNSLIHNSVLIRFKQTDLVECKWNRSLNVDSKGCSWTGHIFNAAVSYMLKGLNAVLLEIKT